MNELKSNVDYQTMFGRESEFYIAQDISDYGSKTYYNLSLDDLREYLQTDYHLYELIKEDKPCKMYFDFDGKYQDMTEEEKEYFKNNKIPTEITSHLKDFCQDNNLPKPLCILSGSSTETKKSIHITIKNIILPTNQHRKAFFDKFINYIDGELITGFFDANVYTKNRLMRLINQSKLSKNVPLKSLHKVNLTSHIITYTDGLDITEIPNDWIEQKKEYIPREIDEETNYEEIMEHLNNISRNTDYKDWSCVGQVLLNLTDGDDEGLDMFIDWSRSASNFDYGACERFWRDNKPNRDYGIGLLVNMRDKKEYVRLLPKAEPKPITELKDISKEDNYYWVDFEREYIGKVFESFYTLKAGIIKDLPRVMVKITYGRGFFVKKEHKDDLCNMVPITDMKRIWFKYNIVVKKKKEKKTEIAEISLDAIYTECKLDLYSHYDIILDKENVDKNTYNGFKGIKAVEVNKEYVDMALINKFFTHIESIICNDSKECSHFFISWLRWIMINPHIKSKVFMFLFSEEGYGKSTIGKFLYEFVFGETASYTCSGLDGLTRHFNKHLAGKLFCQVEELPATSDTFHTQFDKMKNLITDDRFEMTKKGLDSINIKNYINFLACSNNKYSLKIPMKDTRYFCAEITKKMNKNYWTEYYKDFQNQSFANMLYTYFIYTEDDDYVDFNGRPTIPMTQLKEELINFSLPIHEKFYKDIRDGIYRLPESMFKDAFTFKDKEYKYATSLQELYSEYLIWGSINGERDLKRKYLEFKLHRSSDIRFIDLQEKIINVDELEFKRSGRILEV